MKKEIKSTDLEILKAYLLSQKLLEILDPIQDEVKMNLKQHTKMYFKHLQKYVEQVITNTYKTNPEYFNEIISDLNKSVENIDNYFTVLN